MTASSSSVSQRKANAEALANGYTWQKRAVEIVAVTAFTAAAAQNFVQGARFFVHDPSATIGDALLLAPLCFASVLLADFVSGVAHWGFDTWGEPTTPVFGAFIRSFREHHVDQAAITRHDFIETNGDSCLATLILLVPLAFTNVARGEGIAASPHARLAAVAFGLAIAFTNQFHKASHERKPTALQRLLIDWRIVLTPQMHRLHHSGDFSTNYCITTGWMNPFLDAIGFWRKAEWIITALTGAIPRANDKELLVETD